MKSSLDTNTIFESTPGCVILRSGRVNCSTVIYQDRKTWRQSRHYIDSEIQRLRQKLENLKEIRRHLKHAKPAESHEEDETDHDEKHSIAEKQDSLSFNNLNVDLTLPNFEETILPYKQPGELTMPENDTERDGYSFEITTSRSSKKRKIKQYENEDVQSASKRRKLKHQSTNLTDSENMFNTTEDANIFYNFNITTQSYDVFHNNFTTSTPSYTNHHRHHHRHKHHNHSISTTHRYQENLDFITHEATKPTTVSYSTSAPTEHSLRTKTTRVTSRPLENRSRTTMRVSIL